jgi:hypothetical protein
MEGHVMLYIDYFNEESTYTPKDFHGRFRMHKELFMKILHGVREFNNYFMMNRVVVGIPVLSSI